MSERRSDEEVLAQIAAARTSARAAALTEPRAESARYDRRRKLVEVKLTSGAVFAFPPELGQGLAGASPEDLAAVEVSPSGLGLHWEKLDADLLVPALLQGMFGTQAWMRELARKGGSARSAAKTQAARTNGRKGGRPRKAAGAEVHAAAPECRRNSTEKTGSGSPG
jgi:hypothetical protein